MFGNKFSGDEIARAFHKSMGGMKKEASDKFAGNPEDFLVAPSEADDSINSELSEQIDSVASYAQDQVSNAEDQVSHADAPCEKCGDADCKCCEGCGEAECKCEKESDAHDYYISNSAELVLHELGKMAGRLRADKQAFAADMVEATAMSIKDDLVKEASQKMRVAAGLEKMAADMYQQGDAFSGDLLKATLEQLKKQ
ncbi:MAG: hypothetical protein ACXABY_19555 [Candidatus Thorarchaeota archaeon]|jgi:hypothetical protein